MRQTLRGLMAAPTGPFSEYAPTSAGIKILPAYTLQPSGHISLRAGHRAPPEREHTGGLPKGSPRQRPRQKSGRARDQRQSAVSRHRSERGRPRLPSRSRYPSAGIGRGTDRGLRPDAPRSAAGSQIQKRSALGVEFDPSPQYVLRTARVPVRKSATFKLTTTNID